MRKIIKNASPEWVIDAIKRSRRMLAAPPVEDGVLGDYGFSRDDDQRPRLNFLLPRLSQSTMFGGIQTGFKIFFEIAAGLRKAEDWQIRVIPDAGYEREISLVLRQNGCNRYVPEEALDITPKSSSPNLPTRRNDVFIAYNWWTVLNSRRLLEMQAKAFGGTPRPLIYFIQDYEPLFYPMSSTHMLARAAYDLDWPIWGIFNSQQLFDYFSLQGHRIEKSIVFEPRLHPALLGHMSLLSAEKKERTILVYGRGAEGRNCLSLLKAGLQMWSANYPKSKSWAVRSLGSPHAPFTLSDGRTITAEGKLPLEDYARTLLTSSLGISLMASPHPSYPPLEMAHFGIRTITNAFTCKNLAAAHDNIVSLPFLTAGNLAAAVAQACEEWDTRPGGFVNGASHMPGYTKGGEFAFVDGLCRDILSMTGAKHDAAQM
jgi:O-antigen biosynthesis protein